MGDGEPQRRSPAAALELTEIWRAAEKIVYSRTLLTPLSARTRVESDFDPATISKLKESSVDDLTIGGAKLAGEAPAAGLVDEMRLMIVPPSWAAENTHGQITCASNSTSSTSAASEAVPYTSATRSTPDPMARAVQTSEATYAPCPHCPECHTG